MSFNEYLGYVKRYHPIVKQANLTVSIGQANLMRSRGGFDPKVEIDYDRKQFKDTEYYDRLNTTFKIPTWFGVELKGNFQRNEGEYLDNSETLPEDGLYSAGVAMALGQGLWINERMATLKRARFFLEQSKADRDILVNQILYEASRAYFDWLLAYNEQQLYLNFLQNAEIRFKGIKSSALAGDIAAIDTVEAKIVVQDRSLGLEQAKVRYMKSSLTLSNFLWLGENTPVELQSNMKPDTNLKDDIDSTLEIMGISLDSFALENHPKIKSLGFKIRGLQVDKNLMANKLLPTIDLEYNFLTETPDRINSFETFNYKGGLRFVYPLFLRKERGDLKLARYQLQDAQYDFDNTKIAIKNKILAIYNELESFTQQNQMIEDIVENYETLLAAEERKYSFGESSLFLINTRENRLIDAELKQLDIEYKFYNAKAMLFNNLALNPLNL
jgi:outer membrane protein TolC